MGNAGLELLSQFQDQRVGRAGSQLDLSCLAFWNIKELMLAIFNIKESGLRKFILGN